MSIGLCLKGNGKGTFTAVASNKSGLYIPGEVKDISPLTLRNKRIIIAANSHVEV